MEIRETKRFHLVENHLTMKAAFTELKFTCTMFDFPSKIHLKQSYDKDQCNVIQMHRVFDHTHTCLQR